MKTEDFNYILPESYIAQTPIEPRHNSRLMVLDRKTNTIRHKKFWQIGDFLRSGDLLVVNKTRVIPARLFGKKVPGGGKVEVLLLKKREEGEWVCIVGGSGLKPGRKIIFEDGPEGEILEILEGAQRLIRFSQPVEPFLDQIGHVPLPPYIHEKLADPERYQTVYASIPGSAAAPTAGLHFTPELIDGLKDAGIQFADVTLHVGLDTFS
ncbi:MAG: S-adenosylmethionine:tRNA ribosyltransferase-isomerase, partial [Anaerolineaceae bacterium]|nr:S-adenosylmethionine:tRNA ribosyltransferase-isomerase [Anaerolineaceae bacterium]